MKLSNGWAKSAPDPFNKEANYLYQKIIYKSQEKIGLNIYEYNDSEGKFSWELDIQIPEELSIIGKTINILSFAYVKLNFRQIEQHARKIINRLIK